MKKVTEKDLLNWLDKCWSLYKTSQNEWKLSQQAYNRIVELIKIFFAKEISSGPIKKDISRPVLAEWLEGINQAATAMKDHYVMKATTQLIELVRGTGVDKIFVEKKARELMDLFCRAQEEHDELPLHTARNIVRYMQKPEIKKGWLPTAENINALPEPVRNYIADMQTNADPPSMVADNIIMKDTIKTLEKMLEEKPEVTEEWIEKKAKQGVAIVIGEPHAYPPITTDSMKDFIRSLVEEIGK